MSAGAMPHAALRVPLQEALNELEFHLLALGRSRSSALVVEGRRLVARCIALGSFAAPAASARLHKLELVCQPLLAGASRPDNASRLLQFALRLIHELQPQAPAQALCRHLLEYVRGRLAAPADTSAPAGAPKLALLATFCQDDLATAFRQADDASIQEAEPQRLLRWQCALEQALAAEDAGAQCLRPHLLERIELVLALCRHSAWTLEFFCESGLHRALREVQQLAGFCGSAMECTALQALELELLEAHLRGEAPHGRELEEILTRCLRTFADDTGAFTAGLAQPSVGAELDDQARALAAQLGADWQACTAQPEAALHALYCLGWLADAKGARELAAVAGAAWQLWSQYWFLREPPPYELRTLLLALGAGSGMALVPKLLQLWPRRGKAGLVVALASEAETSAGIVRLGAVPSLLAASFDKLVQLRRAELDAPHFLTVLAPELRRELALLERGAAAMKVWPLEQLCTILLELYAACDDGAMLPRDRLWRAHAHLVTMLDRAAAWQEAKADEELLGDLQAWFAACGEVREPPLPPDEFGGMIRLHHRLLAYARTLADVMEKPVRLHLEARTGPLAQGVVDALEAALRPLLKYLLLDQAAAPWSRRAVHRPRVSTVSIAVQLRDGACRVAVMEDSLAPALESAQLRLLQRRMPGACELACEVREGHGRRFTFAVAVVEQRG